MTTLAQTSWYKINQVSELELHEITQDKYNVLSIIIDFHM